jgi:ferritin-like metal-binding protein YciE
MSTPVDVAPFESAWDLRATTWQSHILATRGILRTSSHNSLQELFEHELRDIYDAELRLVEALPKMAEKAHDPAMKKAFNDHLKETEHQVERLEEVFGKLGREAERVKCAAMTGLIAEGEEIVDASGDADVLDAALIGAANRVKHYEIAAYGTARCRDDL